MNSGAILGGVGQVVEMAFPGLLGEGGARYWSFLIAVLSAALLLGGTYASMEKMFVILVAVFTGLTLVCTVILQWTGYAVSWSELASGLSLDVPPEITTALVLTALAMYAGTGVAFGEIWIYTYWCVEKGYARSTGRVEPGEAWAKRAKGWIRIMYTDVLVTMVVYTVSTVCFYLLGAAILHAKQLNPDGRETIVILSSMYTESFGDWAATLFLVGSFFVLLTTVLSGAAGHSRFLADSLAVIGLIDPADYGARLRFIRVFVVVSLLIYSIAYWLFENPPQMLLITSSLIAAVMFPVLGLGVLYLRHRKLDSRIVPGPLITGWAVGLRHRSGCRLPRRGSHRPGDPGGMVELRLIRPPRAVPGVALITCAGVVVLSTVQASAAAPATPSGIRVVNTPRTFAPLPFIVGTRECLHRDPEQTERWPSISPCDSGLYTRRIAHRSPYCSWLDFRFLYQAFYLCGQSAQRQIRGRRQPLHCSSILNRSTTLLSIRDAL